MRPLALGELSQLARDLSGLLRLGYPAVEAVQKLAPGQLPSLSILLQRVAGELQKGESLAGTLQKEPTVLPLFVRMVDAAEKGEELPQGLERAALVMDEWAARRSRCFLATLYPALVFTIVMFLIWIVCVAGGGLIFSLFSNMSINLPFPTRALMWLSRVATNPLVLLPFFGSLVFLWVLVSGRAGWGLSVYRVPLFGAWMLRQEAVIYLKTMAHLVALGTPLVEAARLAVDTCGTPLRGRLLPVAGRLESGDKLSTALRHTGVFPELGLWAIERREATESPRLLEISDLLDRELEISLDRAVVSFEPMVFLGLLFAIGFFIVAVFVPLYRLIGDLG